MIEGELYSDGFLIVWELKAFKHDDPDLAAFLAFPM
jgi:hypothetical protein